MSWTSVWFPVGGIVSRGCQQGIWVAVSTPVPQPPQSHQGTARSQVYLCSVGLRWPRPRRAEWQPCEVRSWHPLVCRERWGETPELFPEMLLSPTPRLGLCADLREGAGQTLSPALFLSPLPSFRPPLSPPILSSPSPVPLPCPPPHSAHPMCGLDTSPLPEVRVPASATNLGEKLQGEGGLASQDMLGQRPRSPKKAGVPGHPRKAESQAPQRAWVPRPSNGRARPELTPGGLTPGQGRCQSSLWRGRP